jgi:L-fuculose-phosphate aldolase
MVRTATSEPDLRRELVRFSKWLSRLGFMPGTAGNLSVRLDDARLLVTPTGLSKFLLKASDIVIVDLQGRLLSGSRKPTSEMNMHLAIYAMRPDISAVIHSHPPIATGFACAGRSLNEVLCQEAVMTLGTVPLATYATTGTGEVASKPRPVPAWARGNPHGQSRCGNFRPRPPRSFFEDGDAGTSRAYRPGCPSTRIPHTAQRKPD